MTNLNYSIDGLKDLLNDLENLSTCLITLSSIPNHIDSSSLNQLYEDQYSLIQTVNCYATVLQASQFADLSGISSGSSAICLHVENNQNQQA